EAAAGRRGAEAARPEQDPCRRPRPRRGARARLCSLREAVATVSAIDPWRSDAAYVEPWVHLGDRIEVVVLGHNRKAVFDRGGGDQRVEHARTDACAPAVVHEPCEGGHHCFADGDGVGCTGQRKRVGAAGTCVGVGGSENSELELAYRDDRYGELGGQLAERSLGLLGDEDRRVGQTSTDNSSIAPPAR